MFYCSFFRHVQTFGADWADERFVFLLMRIPIYYRTGADADVHITLIAFAICVAEVAYVVANFGHFTSPCAKRECRERRAHGTRDQVCTENSGCAEAFGLRCPR